MIGGVEIMGVLNVTPDSFSDGGRWSTAEMAVAHGRDLIADGADVVDVGGESTRPGAVRIDADREQDRVLPVVRELSDLGAEISIDTVNASTALAAVAAGAGIVNDVSGGLADPDMLAAVASTGARMVLMHWKGFLVAGERPHYDDVVSEVRDHLARRVEAAVAAGIPAARLIVDPGLGFSKNAEHNWALLRALPELVSDGLPVLIGASRKRFLAELTDSADLSLHSIAKRDAATASISVHTAANGGWGVRVHDVAGTSAALLAWQQYAGASEAAHV